MKKKFWIIIAAIAFAAFAIGAAAGSAEAHLGTRSQAEHKLVATHEHGQCGKGTLNWCYTNTMTAYVKNVASRHYYRVHGYWQEHHPCSLCGAFGWGGGRYSCEMDFYVSGQPHGTIDLPRTKHCWHV
jgi:hypothetical protein